MTVEILVDRAGMVRFRLTSWRSWDLLQVDSDFLASPPELNPMIDCQVRLLQTDARDCAEV